jgi:phage-related protein (TIGR01555 family)
MSVGTTLKRVFRMDGWANFLTGVNASTRDKRQASIIALPQVFFQQDLEHFFRGNDLARRICTLPALDMTRKGYELDIDDSDSDVKKGIHQYKKKLGWFQELFRLCVFSRLYGRCYVLVGVDDGQAQDQPVNFDNIRSIKYINVIDPWGLRVKDLQRDPMAPDFGQPETFYVNITSPAGTSPVKSQLETTAEYGTIVHASRVLWLDGSLMTPFQARFSGANINTSNLAWIPDSVFVALYSVIRDYDASWDSSAILLQDFAQAVYKIKGLGEMMAANGEQQVRDRMAIVDESRSVLRAMLLDAEFEDFERKATPITGLPEMMDRWLQRVSAAAEIPIPLLFGSPTGGLNASDDGAYEGYYNLIQAKQQSDLEPVIRKFTKLVMNAQDCEATGGTEPESWTVCFEELWQLSAAEAATMRKTQAETDAIYITNQVVTPNEVAVSRFGGDKYSTDTTIDVDAHEEYQSQADEVKTAEATALVAQHGAVAESATAPAPAPAPDLPGSDPVSAKEPHERATRSSAPAPTSAPVKPPVAGAKAATPAASGPTPSPTGGDNVQQTALNGTQVSSLVAIVTAVAAEEIPRDAAVQIIALSYQVTPEQADKILASAGNGFKPKPPDPPMIAGMPGGKPAPGKGSPFGAKPAPKKDGDETEVADDES